MDLIDMVEKNDIKEDRDNFKVGDTVEVHVIIREGDKERIQMFKGNVISRRGSGAKKTFIVRKISFGVGIERIFPLYSKSIKKIKVIRKGKVRRSKLYYLRDLKGKAASIKESK